jgi:hypothetical protein
MKIYVAMSQDDYELTSVIKAFVNKDACQLFIKECNDYSKTRIPFPEIETNYSEEIWCKYDNEDMLWSKKHPAGQYKAYADNFFFIETKLEN